MYALIRADGDSGEPREGDAGRAPAQPRLRAAGLPGRAGWIAKGHYVAHRLFFADEATALAAGYRPCAACLPDRYASWKAGRMEVELRAKGPFDADHMLGSSPRARSWGSRRSRVGHTAGRLRFRRPGDGLAAFGRGRVIATFDVAERRDVHEGFAVPRPARPRRRHGRRPPRSRPTRRRAAGRSLPGRVDAADIVVRAVVGQQVSVAGARTVLGRLTAVARRAGGIRDVPGAASFPHRRAGGRGSADAARPANAVRALAAADLDDLQAVPGIGPWTAAYVAMRLGDPDILLETDLVVRRALERLGPAFDPESWRPFRSYATHQLWLAAAPPSESVAAGLATAARRAAFGRRDRNAWAPRR